MKVAMEAIKAEKTPAEIYPGKPVPEASKRRW